MLRSTAKREAAATTSAESVAEDQVSAALLDARRVGKLVRARSSPHRACRGSRPARNARPPRKVDTVMPRGAPPVAIRATSTDFAVFTCGRSATPSAAQRARIAAQFRSSRSRSSTRRGVSSASRSGWRRHQTNSSSGRERRFHKVGRGAIERRKSHAVVPVDRHADTLRTRDIRGRSGDEQRAAGAVPSLREHRPVGLGPRLVEAGLLGGDQRRERNAAARGGRAARARPSNWSRHRAARGARARQRPPRSRARAPTRPSGAPTRRRTGRPGRTARRHRARSPRRADRPPARMSARDISAASAGHRSADPAAAFHSDQESISAVSRSKTTAS